jgi:hypothetical protein
MLQLTAATRISCGNNERCTRESHRTTCAHEIYDAAFERFAKRLKRIAPILTDLVKDEQSAMRPGEFAGRQSWAATDQPRNGQIVVWRAQRWARRICSVKTTR